MRTRYFILCLAVAALFAGCVKDADTQFIRLYASAFEPDANASKAAVAGKYTYWLNGEDVRINNSVYTVSVSSGSDEATASDVALGPQNRCMAVYPSSVYVSNSSTNYTIAVPHQYFYKESGGMQVLEGLPMAAYYSGTAIPTELHFGHVTAALTVRVKNDKSHGLDLDRIVLVNSEYQLCGNVTFDISRFADGSTPAITPNKRGVADSVVIHFVETPKHVDAGQYLDVQVPILPVGTDASVFTIRVYSHKQGSRYIYSRSTASRNNSIGRSCLGYAVAKYDAEQTAEDLFDVQQGTDDNGNPINLYEIGSADELRNLTEAMDSLWSTSDGSGHYHTSNYVVVADIDMQGEELTPIHYYNLGGNTRCYFDGQGHTISNFIASSENENEPNCCGLFGKTSGDSITIRNLNLSDASYDFAHIKEKIIGYDGNYATAVGGVYAVVDKMGIVIENCTVQNIHIAANANSELSDKTQTDFYAAGIVGLVQTGVTIRNCYVSNVTIDNSQDASSVLVDQFGPAIGRIDVGDGNGSHTYQKAGDNCYVTIVENFTYDQGANTLVFDPNLKNIRYGGVVANITRGGRLELINCKAHHNVRVYKPTAAMFCGGLIGCNKLGLNMAYYMDSNCEVTGVIDNQAVTSYNNNYSIDKYVTDGMNCGNPTRFFIMKTSVVNGNTPSSTCTNTLSVTGKTTTFHHQSQVFPTYTP
ncbi:MAG: hypothetical protein IJU81_07765 [Bacteroidales bacterium]|nr:hypothetical protein [Bacteroidales bacterium]